MSIIAYMLIGLIVGTIVRVAMPPTQLVGFWGSALLGMAGGLIGGLIGAVFAPSAAFSSVHPLGIVLSIALAALVSVGLTIATRNKRFA
ncbi:MAG: GlsB/YeaQ/YmgE family stress response membrane protein [Archangium sp.]